MGFRADSRHWLAGGFGLAIAAALVLLARGGPRRSSLAMAERPAEPLVVQPVESGAKAVTSPFLEEAQRTREEVGTSSARVQDEDRLSSTEDPLEVRVVTGPGGPPASGARVLLEDEPLHTEGEEARRLRDERAGLERRLAVLGTARVADALGVARFPTPRVRSWITARLGDSLALRTLDPAEPGPVVLTLEPDPPFRARVVDAEGKPVAGIPVALRVGKHVGDYVRAPTDSDGVAVLRAGEHREALRGSGARLGLALLLRAAVEVAVDPVRPPSEPVVLVLPPTGSVAITLADELGARWTKSTRTWAGLAPRFLAEIGQGDEGSDFFVVHTSTGEATWEHVGLGLELALGTETEGHAEELEVVAGPRLPGERVEARLVLAKPLPVLTGRLLDARGRPLRSAEVEVRGSEPERTRWSWGMGRVDAEGRFRKTCDANGMAYEGGLEIELVVRGSGPTQFARLRLAGLQPGDNELGDVYCTEIPLVLAGTIRDERGNPVRGASVELYFGGQEGRWGTGVRVTSGTIESDAFGRFELREPVVVDVLGLQVDAPGFIPYGPHLVARGTSGLTIELQRGGWISCELLFDGNWLPNLSLEPRPPTRYSTFHGPHEQRLGPVAPGVYAVRYTESWNHIDGLIPDVRVVAGETTVDPRLHPLDLRGLLDTLAFTVVDRDGAPVPDPLFEVQGDEPDEFRDCHARHDGERWLVAVKLPLRRLRVSAPGFRDALLTDLDCDQRVVLEHGPRLRWVVVGALPELPEGWRLEGWLSGRGLDLPLAAPRIDLGGGVAEFCVSAPGTHTLGYRLVQRRAGRELAGANFEEDSPLTFEIVEASDVQILRVPAPSAALQREMLDYIDDFE